MDLKYNFGWGSNDNGNLLSVTNDMDSNRSVTYGYDHLNRIASATTANTDCTVLSTGITKNWGESFTIDPWGNLTNRTVTKCSADPLSVIALPNNQLSGFGYDADGNMTSNGSTTYVYDGESRLQSVNGVTYTYDGEGNRVIKSSGTEYWGAGPMLESSSTGHLMFEYIFAGGKRIARRDVSTGLVSYYLTDNLGSTNKFVKSTGVIQNDSDYYPYGGERIYAQGATGQNYRFSGKEYDSESGLDNFGARYDSSSLGRFMTPDWGVAPVTVPYAVFGDPQSLNLYAYVENGPVNRVDADGHGCAGPVGGASTTDVGTTGPSCEQLQHAPANTNAADASQSTLTEAQAQNQSTVTVEYVQGHGGNPAGHAVISVDGKTPVGLDQKKASAAAALEDKTTPGAVVPVDPSRKVKDQATIQVTPEQAAKIQTFLDKASTNPPNYNLYHSNCAQFCERALQAGGVKDVPNDLTPKGLVNDLNHAPSFVDYLRAVPFPPPIF